MKINQVVYVFVNICMRAWVGCDDERTQNVAS